MIYLIWFFIFVSALLSLFVYCVQYKKQIFTDVQFLLLQIILAMYFFTLVRLLELPFD